MLGKSYKTFISAFSKTRITFEFSSVQLKTDKKCAGKHFVKLSNDDDLRMKSHSNAKLF